MAFEQALLAGGAAVALLSGVAAAELGLAPVRLALEAEAPSLDTQIADADPRPIQVDTAAAAQTSPPPVAVPISAPARETGANDHAVQPDLDGPSDDDVVARDEVTRQPLLEFDQVPDDPAKISEDPAQDQEAPVSSTAPPAEDPPPPVTRG